MAEIPEDLLRRSAEAKAKALGLPVEQVLAEMKGEAPPSQPSGAAEAKPVPDVSAVSVPEPEAAPAEEPAAEPEAEPAAPEAAAAPAPAAAPADIDIDTLVAQAAEAGGIPESLVRRSAEAKAKSLGVPMAQILADMAGVELPEGVAESLSAEPATPPTAPVEEPEPAAEPEAAPSAVATATRTEEAPSAAPEEPPSNGHAGNGGRVAASVSPRPVVPPAHTPEGVRTQRLLTVVKAKAIQQVKPEPTDKVNTWPHLMLVEFVALLAMTGFLLLLSVILQAPLLEPANFNATPNPSKAPWYFLGLQELLSYFDPQIAGVTVPTVIGLIGFMMIPYVDRNPSTKPSDRKFAIMLYTIFLTGSATLTILGVLFRGRGFNFAYPWRDGIFFDDLKDWVHFE
jgi:menaquinol-cytochrome c reductase cytochrome b/c subunit